MSEESRSAAYVKEQMRTAEENGYASPGAEANILRRMMTVRGVAEEMVNTLTQEDFSNPEYGIIFRAIRYLVINHRPVDMFSIDQALEKNAPGQWKPETLVELRRHNEFTVEDWQDISGPVKVVKDLSTRRRAIALMVKLVGDLHDTSEDVGEVLAKIKDAADAADTGTAEWMDCGSVGLDTVQYVERRQKGEIKVIPTGINGLDNLIGGFYAGELTVIGARPSVGKSAFGINIAMAAAVAGFKVGVVSCEMSAEGIGQRLLANTSGVDGMEIRRANLGEEAWERVSEGLTMLGAMPIDFMFNCDTVEDVVAAARRRVQKKKLDILIVDYLQFMETKQRFKEERLRIGYISHMLKRLATDAQIPVIALAQVTRAGEGTMPTMKMLRESGNIEQDADGIIFLHKPDSDDDPTVPIMEKGIVQKMKGTGYGYLVVGVAKQRNGATGQTSCIFDSAHMRYADAEGVM